MQTYTASCEHFIYAKTCITLHLSGMMDEWGELTCSQLYLKCRTHEWEKSHSCPQEGTVTLTNIQRFTVSVCCALKHARTHTVLLHTHSVLIDTHIHTQWCYRQTQTRTVMLQTNTNTHSVVTDSQGTGHLPSLSLLLPLCRRRLLR